MSMAQTLGNYLCYAAFVVVAAAAVVAMSVSIVAFLDQRVSD